MCIHIDAIHVHVYTHACIHKYKHTHARTALLMCVIQYVVHIHEYRHTYMHSYDDVMHYVIHTVTRKDTQNTLVAHTSNTRQKPSSSFRCAVHARRDIKCAYTHPPGKSCRLSIAARAASMSALLRPVPFTTWQWLMLRVTHRTESKALQMSWILHVKMNILHAFTTDGNLMLAIKGTNSATCEGWV